MHLTNYSRHKNYWDITIFPHYYYYDYNGSMNSIEGLAVGIPAEQHASESVSLGIPHVSLSSEGQPIRLEVVLDRIVTPATEGNIIDGITIDRKSPILIEMYERAYALRELPERTRPHRVLELLRSRVQYAYGNVMADVAKEDPDKAAWVDDYIHGDKDVTLSQVVDHTYAICRHIAVGYLALAQEAGIQGAYATYQAPGTIDDPRFLMRNVMRADTQTPLFRSTPVGNVFYDGHAWVELKMSDGEWLPVDPITQLVGDTREAMETFRAANYRESVGLDVEGFPPYVGVTDSLDLQFIPGEITHHGVIKINSKPKMRPSAPKKGAIIRVNTQSDPTSYDGPLHLSFSNRPSRRALNVTVRNVVVSK